MARGAAPGRWYLHHWLWLELFTLVNLAFLALYRDWRVLIVAAAVVAADHFLRGLYWPRSVYGIACW